MILSGIESEYTDDQVPSNFTMSADAKRDIDNRIEN